MPGDRAAQWRLARRCLASVTSSCIPAAPPHFSEVHVIIPCVTHGETGAQRLWPTSEAGWSDPSSERTPRLKVVSSAGHMTALLPESAQGSSQVQDFSLAAAWEGLCLAGRNSWRILRTLSQERIQRLFSGTGPFSSDSQHISDSAPSFKIQIEIRTASKPLICSQPHGGR